MFPVHVGGLELGCRRMAAIRDAHSAADTEPALGEVQSVAYGAADPVVRNPPDELGVEAAGEDQVLDESADLVVGKRRDDRAPQPECTPQPAGNVVLTTALAGSERPGSANPPLAGVETEHDLTERHDVIPALGGGTDGEGGHQRTPSVWALAASCRAASATARDVSTVIPEKSPDAMRSRGTIHEPPTAITDARSRYSCRLSGPTPPVGTNRTPPERRREGRDGGGAARGPGREELHGGQPQLERGLDLGRRHGTGQGEHAELLTTFDHRAAEPGRHHVAGPRRHGLIHLGRVEDGAGAYQDV